MHRNYFLFEKQVYSLNKKLQSSIITECFTHRKDELVLLLESDERYHLRVGINSHTPYILLDKAQSIKDPHVYLFKEINGKTVEILNIKPYDKIIDIQIEGFTLKCIFFGKGRNVFLLNPRNKIIQTFKKTYGSAIQNLIDSPDKVFSPFDLYKIDRENIQQNLSLFIMKSIGGFNKILSEELCFRANLESSILLSEINDREWNVLNKSIVNIMEEFKQENFFIYERKEGNPILSLIELRHIPDDSTKKIYHDINMIWKQFSYISQQKNNLERALNHGREKIAGRIKYLEKTLKKISDFKDLDEEKKLSELKGHLLQTYSSEIKKGETKVQLKNIYAAKEDFISIELNPKLSIQENAVKYFNKYKDISEQKNILKIKKDTYEDELNYWKKKYHDTEKIDNIKNVEKLEQILSQKRLIQKGGKRNKSVSILDISSFNRILLSQQWEILIGKNAQNNDLLTFKFARKHDLWFHAQGVSGSHIIIRVPDKNKKPPMNIIKQAASVAAYFSAAKNSSTVPVNYTEVRYVRKPRKSAAGTVIISNSKTVFVEPKKYI